MFSKLLHACAVAMPLAALAFAGTAMADYTTQYYIPVQPIHKQAAHPAVIHHAAMMRRGAMSCGTARAMIRSNGYRNVVTRTCRGPAFMFSATRHGRPVFLRVNPRSGRISRA